MSLIVRIEKSAFGGCGLAFHEKCALFIPFTIPGELVEITDPIFKKDAGFAGLISVIEPSPYRIDPECPSFGKCGGCDYLHMSYGKELLEKKSVVEDALIRIGKFPKESIPEIDTISDNRFHYRSHATAKISSEGLAGFFAKDSHNIIPFPPQGCLLLDRKLSSALMQHPDGEEIKGAVDRNNDVHLSTGRVVIISERESGFTFERNLFAFFQANRFLRSRMIEQVLEYAALTEELTVLDIGCGGGFFTLPAASQCRNAKGIDISRESIDAARKNAGNNSIRNVTFETKPDDRISPRGDRADIVIADPPRAGLSSTTKSSLIAMSPQRIVYISCNVTTLARDLKEFCSQGYHLSRFTMIDMFPGTLHIEAITLLEKIPS